MVKIDILNKIAIKQLKSKIKIHAKVYLSQHFLLERIKNNEKIKITKLITV